MLSSAGRERSALVTLSESAGWVATEAGGLREARRLLARQSPRVILARHQLSDGFADHLLREIGPETPGRPRLIILASPGLAAAEEARQISLGADCVLRDPVRSEVLLAYLARYLRRKEQDRSASARAPSVLAFAGGELRPEDRTLRLRRATRTLTPREAALAEVLAARPGELVTYETLYGEVLGRR